MSKKARANLLLLLTAMIWGSGFVAQSVGMEDLGPLGFLCARSVLAGLVLLPLIRFRARRGMDAGPQSLLPKKRARRYLALGGVCCGAALFAGSILQQVGICYTTVGKAGFLTALYIIFVPLVGLFFGRRVRAAVWCGAALAAAGMYLMCIQGRLALSRGDLLMLLCALGYTAHILIISRFSPHVDGVQLACIQFFVCAALAGLALPFFETISLTALLHGWKSVCYAGILSSGVGYTLQIVAQKDTEPAVASLLMSLESVFSALFGALFLGERFAPAQALGAALLFAAVILAQLPERRKIETI